MRNNVRCTVCATLGHQCWRRGPGVWGWGEAGCARYGYGHGYLREAAPAQKTDLSLTAHAQWCELAYSGCSSNWHAYANHTFTKYYEAFMYI